MLDNIRIVLVNPSHPGNIGATARAMKTMGLKKLYLVNPRLFPHTNANEMASGALDVLGQAVVVDELDEALTDCELVVGTSARERAIPWPQLLPRELADLARIEAQKTTIAIVFGREQSGLTNDELDRCHFHLIIPSNPDYSSLNLAAAVQVVAYELRVASLNQKIETKWDYAYADTT
ncbi:MAG: RNA methyltransferase, partial [Gammaproteobacteria bacterium]|nr:RNA methyltransferase [Gammaproteobacteria bacterium]